MNETWRRGDKTILRCTVAILGKTEEGTRRDKAARFWNEKVHVAMKKKKKEEEEAYTM